MTRLRTTGMVLGVHVALTACMTWPYVNYRHFAEATYGGDQRLIVWTLAWANHATLTDASLFDANIFFPAADSLRYNEHLFALSLFTLPWALLGASPVLAHNVVLWLAFPLNGLLSFLLIRRFVHDGLAAFAGSLVFTYSFYVMSHAHGHLHLIWLWTIPWSLILLERWLREPGIVRVALWIASLLLAILTSWYVAVFALIANALFGLLLVAAERRDSRRHRPTDPSGAPWRRRGWQFLAALLVCGACVYPFARHYQQIESRPQELSANAADAAAYMVPPLNSLVGRWWRQHINDAPREIWGERTLFAGWTALTLGLIGLLRLLTAEARSPRTWFLPLLALIAVLLSFGPTMPGLGETPLAPFRFLSSVPGLDGIRAPARFAALAMLGLGGLVGFGGIAILKWAGTRGRVVLMLMMPVMLLEWRVVDFPAGKPEQHAIPVIYRSQQVRTAHALVSIPEYSGQTDWVRGADYLYYSTAHWRPIVNGFGRTEPLNYAQIVSAVRAFPASTSQLEKLGVQYVVVHASRFDQGPAMVANALDRSDCRLVAQAGADYLFEIARR